MTDQYLESMKALAADIASVKAYLGNRLDAVEKALADLQAGPLPQPMPVTPAGTDWEWGLWPDVTEEDYRNGGKLPTTDNPADIEIIGMLANVGRKPDGTLAVFTWEGMRERRAEILALFHRQKTYFADNTKVTPGFGLQQLAVMLGHLVSWFYVQPLGEMNVNSVRVFDGRTMEWLAAQIIGNKTTGGPGLG